MITVIRQTPSIVVTAPDGEQPSVVTVTRTTQQITVKRDGLAGPQGPAGPKGESGEAYIPSVFDGGNF